LPFGAPSPSPSPSLPRRRRGSDASLQGWIPRSESPRQWQKRLHPPASLRSASPLFHTGDFWRCPPYEIGGKARKARQGGGSFSHLRNLIRVDLPQGRLSSANASIGDPDFQPISALFPTRTALVMTVLKIFMPVALIPEGAITPNGVDSGASSH
jgi:hypothetical protein